MFAYAEEYVCPLISSCTKLAVGALACQLRVMCMFADEWDIKETVDSEVKVNTHKRSKGQPINKGSKHQATAEASAPYASSHKGMEGKKDHHKHVGSCGTLYKLLCGWVHPTFKANGKKLVTHSNTLWTMMVRLLLWRSRDSAHPRALLTSRMPYRLDAQLKHATYRHMETWHLLSSAKIAPKEDQGYGICRLEGLLHSQLYVSTSAGAAVLVYGDGSSLLWCLLRSAQEAPRPLGISRCCRPCAVPAGSVQTSSSASGIQ